MRLSPGSDPDDWNDEDVAERKVTELGGLLIVRQTYTVHEQIKRILADLRRMQKDGAFSALDDEHRHPWVPRPISDNVEQKVK